MDILLYERSIFCAETKNYTCYTFVRQKSQNLWEFRFVLVFDKIASYEKDLKETFYGELKPGNANCSDDETI